MGTELIPDLYSDLKATVGQSLLVAGVAPTTVGLGIFYWYRHHDEDGITKALLADAKGSPLGSALLILIVSLIVYLAARALLEWVRLAPARSPQPYVDERALLQKAERRLVATMTLLRWARLGFPAWPGVTLWDSSFDLDEEARRTLEKITRVRDDPEAERALAELVERAREHAAKEPGKADPVRADLDVLSVYLEMQRQAVVREIGDRPLVSRKFRLGRISAELDAYPSLRYGMDAPTMLSRLMVVADDKVRDRLSAASANLEALFGFGLVAGALFGYVGIDQIRLVSDRLFGSGDSVFDAQALAALTTTCFGAIVCWIAAPRVFRVLASQTAATIDMNRQLLLDHLGVGKDLDFETENIAFQKAWAFFADASGELWQPRWNAQDATLVIHVRGQPPFMADGHSVIPLEIVFSYRGCPFAERSISVWASRGDFAGAEPGKRLTFEKITGTRAAPAYVWRAVVQAAYVAPLEAGPVEIVAASGEIAANVRLDFAYPETTHASMVLAIEKLEPVTDPKGLRVSLKARIRLDHEPGAIFAGAAPKFSASAGALLWDAAPFGSDASAAAIGFVPSTCGGQVSFRVEYGAAHAQVELPAGTPPAA